jgi:hypothetical protein
MSCQATASSYEWQRLAYGGGSALMTYFLRPKSFLLSRELDNSLGV